MNDETKFIRDLIASQAAAVIFSQSRSFEHSDRDAAKEAAEAAYILADAMLEARERHQQAGG